MSKNEGNQKIKCNVVQCAHNSVEDCTCRLDSIKVCQCDTHVKKDFKDDTACASYDYAGDLNVRSQMNGES